MEDEQDEQPIDLSFNRCISSSNVNSSRSSENFSSTSSTVSYLESRANSSNHSLVSSTQVSSESHPVKNCYVNSLLRYLLLSKNSCQQEAVKEFREHFPSQQEPLHSTQSSKPAADSTHQIEPEIAQINRVSKNVRSCPKKTLHQKKSSSASTGRPLTGRYVRLGTGASELTLASLRQMLQLKTNRCLAQQIKSTNTRKSSKA